MRIVTLCYSIALLIACTDREHKQELFVLMPADSTGIDFHNKLSHTAEFNTYTYRNFYNGGGVGVGDLNGDGLVEIFFCGNMVDNKLYLNHGDFHFEDITDRAGVASKNIWSTGVSFADVNSDGLLDIYVCKSGQPGGENRHNELFINNGDLTFTESAVAFGIADEGLSSHAAFFDYDQDGDLDIYLLNNSFRPVGGYDMRPGLREIRDTLGGNKLYRNLLAERGFQENKPLFVDVSEEAGIYGSSIGFGLGVTIGDLNKDGWQDIFVSNDFFERDYLYINQHDGTFKEDLVNQMREISMGSMGADMADINNDGLPEIFVTEMLPHSEDRYKTKMTFENWDKYQLAVNSGYHHQFTRNVLQLNLGSGNFSEIGRLAGVEATDWSWGALIADLDLDGYKDLYVANGIYKDLLDQDYINFYSNDPKILQSIRNREEDAILKLIDLIPSQPLSNIAFKNLGNLTFADHTIAWGLDTSSFSNGSAYADLDNDGDLDLLVNNCNMPAFVFRNQRNHLDSMNFLQVVLQGSGLNTHSIGAQVKVTCQSEFYYQELSPMRGFQSCVDPCLTFGLGTHQRVDELEIRWPDGTLSRLEDVPGNQRLILRQSDLNSIQPGNDLSFNTPLYSEAEHLVPDFVHQENEFVDFDRDRLLINMLSAEGPKLATADVNGDNLDDFYVGGAQGQPGQLFVQLEDGNFITTNEGMFRSDFYAEDLDAAFFDVDGDQDQDLMVASGGNEYPRGARSLANRLYLNDGTGLFSKSLTAFDTVLHQSSSCLAPGDADGDGDLDVFIGTRLITGVYGLKADGELWLNDGQGNFSNGTHLLAPELLKVGMVTDAEWADYDHDQDLDLIVVGEWMPITIFQNEGGKFSLRKMKTLNFTHGFWNCIEVADLDQDGWEDLVLGNLGRNSRLRASVKQPITMYVNDFDGNNTPEQMITTYQGDQAYPLVLRQDLVMQLPELKKKYLYHKDYQLQTIEDVFTERQLKSAVKSQIYFTESSIAWNLEGKSFEMEQLPTEVQFAPVYAVSVNDFDRDGRNEILFGGNYYRVKPEIGKYDGSQGLLVTVGKDRSTQVWPLENSGIKIIGEIRDFQQIRIGDKDLILVSRNNERLTALIKTTDLP